MKEKDPVDRVKEALDRTGLSLPVPDDVKKHIRRSKAGNFRKVLKKTGGYSIIFGSISYIFFTLKKYGLSVTIIKSAVIWGISLILSVAAVTAGIYFSARYFIPSGTVNRTMVPVESGLKEMEIPEKEAPARRSTAAPSSGKLIGINTFKGADVSREEKRAVTDAVTASLKQYLDDTTGITVNRSGSRRAGLVLLGSVERNNGSYIINARLVRVSDAKIIMYTQEKIESLDSIESASERIALRIISTDF